MAYQRGNYIFTHAGISNPLVPGAFEITNN